ncbi:hypothetical protein J6590_049752 [Homalodisca vitripennis]|nr:hypothetical protein J6590_049752 [Homalodisca vitripennis]
MSRTLGTDSGGFINVYRYILCRNSVSSFIKFVKVSKRSNSFGLSTLSHLDKDLPVEEFGETNLLLSLQSPCSPEYWRKVAYGNFVLKVLQFSWYRIY